jgi:hypothetical protein
MTGSSLVPALLKARLVFSSGFSCLGTSLSNVLS